MTSTRAAPSPPCSTDAVLFARAMVEEGMRQLAAGIPAEDLKRGIDAAVEAADRVLSREPADLNLTNPALLVPPSDRTLGQIVADHIDTAAASGNPVLQSLEAMGHDGPYVRERLVLLARSVPSASAGRAGQGILAGRKCRMENVLVALGRAHSRLTRMHACSAAESAGIRVVQSALERPLLEILRQANEDPCVILGQVLEGIGQASTSHLGRALDYFPETGMGDFRPALVSAIKGAAAVAGALLTTHGPVLESGLSERHPGRPSYPRDR